MRPIQFKSSGPNARDERPWAGRRALPMSMPPDANLHGRLSTSQDSAPRCRWRATYVELAAAGDLGLAFCWRGEVEGPRQDRQYGPGNVSRETSVGGPGGEIEAKNLVDSQLCGFGTKFSGR